MLVLQISSAKKCLSNNFVQFHRNKKNLKKNSKKSTFSYIEIAGHAFFQTKKPILKNLISQSLSNKSDYARTQVTKPIVYSKLKSPKG